MRVKRLGQTILTVTVVGAALCGLVTGCAGQTNTSQGDRRILGKTHSREHGKSPARSHHLQSVPYFPDETDQCGPATLASVLTSWGTPIEPNSLKREVYLTKVKGSFPLDLLLAAERHGFHAETYKGDLENVKAEIETGHPLIAFLNLGTAVFPRGHYVVITGYDDGKQGLYVHSGLTPDAFLKYDQFLQGWEKTGRWTLKILP